MKRGAKKRWWLLGGCLAGLLVAGLMMVAGAIFFFAPGGDDRDGTAIETAREWARFQPIPPSARALDVEVMGSAMTREFKITFRDSPANIRSWIAASPGPSSVTPTLDADGWKVYDYPAGRGAVFAQIRVSPDGGQVVISTCWS